MLSLKHLFRRLLHGTNVQYPAKLRCRGSRLQLEHLEDRCVPSTAYSINSLLDTNTGVGNAGTLRYVLNQANTNHTGTAADPDTIQFATSSGTISVGAPLPTLAANEVAVIDATTIAGYSGTPLITLDGTAAGPIANGLTISGGSSTVKALDIINFSGNGIQLDTNGGNTVLSCVIGITTSGIRAANGGDGILINGVSKNSIGSTTAVGSSNGLGGNVISGNRLSGVHLVGTGADGNTIAGNYIGTNLSGTASVGNGLDGVQLVNANNNLIGHADPITGIDYFPATGISPPVTGWEGIRNSNTAKTYLISGNSNTTGLLFDGTISGTGKATPINFPNQNTDSTFAYGPDNQGNGMLGIVGTYKLTGSSTVNGYYFQGTVDQLSNPAKYTTIDYPGSSFNYVHSTMGGLAVMNFDFPPDHGQGGLPLGPGHAIIYDTVQKAFLQEIKFPGSKSNTVYGIWYNGNNSYTMCGGYSPTIVNNFDDPNRPIGQGYLVDYDSKTGTFSHYTSFSYPFGVNFVTHFQGISGVEKGVYTLAADSAQAGTNNPVQGSWVSVRRNTDGSFDNGVWVNLNYPLIGTTSSANSVYGNNIVGIAVGSGTTLAYQATINVGFQLSNVISGNAGNGISLTGSNNNRIAMNYIGTDITGNLKLGNSNNGILLTDGSTSNLIGGEATGGNDPTNGVFVRPPQGNLISANGTGVLIQNLSTKNQLSGNFIGTTASGNSALGNATDGVAIINADDNSLLGCTFQQDPFVFYNVIGGNGRSGLRITSSNSTTVHANSFGLGADNNTPVGNAVDGTLIEGTSQNTQYGGVIPLGNISAGNGRNGVEISDTASGTVCFNTFAGLPAFIDKAVPNTLDGFLVTSTGGNNVLRTNVVSGNGANGIHIAGAATGVQVTEVIIGMNTDGTTSLPNGANGILIDGAAHDNSIGGFQPSIIPENLISANGMNGIAIVGNAFKNTIFHSRIGTNVKGIAPFGNAGAGIFIGGNAQNNVIGGTDAGDQNLISGNLGSGIQISGTSRGTQVFGNLIGTDVSGTLPMGNHAVGVLINTSNGNQIGGTATGQANTIAFNAIGVIVETGTGNSILSNSIYSNSTQGILLGPNGNHNQPAPVLTRAIQPNTLHVIGTLTAAANTTYSVQIFSTPSGTPAGQGQTLLGTIPVTTNASGVGTITFLSSMPVANGSTLTATATDPANNTSMFSAPISVMSAGVFAVGADAGGGPQVNVYNSATAQFLYSFFAYDASFTGGVRVAVADVQAFGIPAIITGPGPGGGPNVRVFDSFTGEQISGPTGSFMAFDSAFTGGVYVASGDVAGIGRSAIIAGAGAGGGPNVKVFDGITLAVLYNFNAFDPAFAGGVTVAAGDVNADGKADIIAGAGPGAGPNIAVYSGATGGLLQSFYAFATSFSGGVYVAAGDINNDGHADIFAGAGAGGGPNVTVYSGVDDALLQSFFAFNQSFSGGVRVGSFLPTTPGHAAILTGAGPGGGPQVIAYDGTTLAVLDSFFAFNSAFDGGVFVGGT